MNDPQYINELKLLKQCLSVKPFIEPIFVYKKKDLVTKCLLTIYIDSKSQRNILNKQKKQHKPIHLWIRNLW